VGAAAATINKDLGALGRCFTLAIREGWIDHKPHFQRLQEADPRQGFVEHDQYLAIRQHLPAVYQDALDFGYYSGWRKGEITGLTWALVDLQSGTNQPTTTVQSKEREECWCCQSLRQAAERHCSSVRHALKHASWFSCTKASLSRSGGLWGSRPLRPRVAKYGFMIYVGWAFVT
jgi:integrase